MKSYERTQDAGIYMALVGFVGLCFAVCVAPQENPFALPLALASLGLLILGICLYFVSSHKESKRRVRALDESLLYLNRHIDPSNPKE